MIWIALLLAGCSFQTNKQDDAALLGDRPSADLMARVSYRDANEIFQRRCVACHGNSGGVNLESLAAARSALPQIRQSTIVEQRMPKSPMPPLTQSERLTLWAWIEAGAPEFPVNGGGGEPIPPSPPPLTPTFASIQARILDVKCIDCHEPGGKAERIPFLSREDLIDSPLEIVIPGNAEESGLVLALTPGARKPMPPPSSGISPVSPEDLEVIKTWISRGAKD